MLIRSLGALAVLTLLYASVDMVEAGSVAQIGALALLGAYVLKVPTIVTQLLPMALAFGTLLTVAGLRRNGEWDAMALAGLSPVRIAARLLTIPLAATALAYVLSSNWAPASMTGYESALGMEPVAPSGWVQDGGEMARVGEEGDDGLLRLALDDSGRVVRWRFRSGGQAWSWSEADGWMRGTQRLGNDLPTKGIVLPARGMDGMVGASWTSARLRELAARLEEAGLDSRPLRAQLSLRVALIAACALVPAIALLLSLFGDTTRAARLMVLGLAVSTAYWLMVVIAWNGSLWGTWGEGVLGWGVPGIGVSIVSILLGALGGLKKAV